MAKKGFPSGKMARKAADQLTRIGIPYVAYHYRDAVSGERKWFLRRKPSTSHRSRPQDHK